MIWGETHKYLSTDTQIYFTDRNEQGLPYSECYNPFQDGLHILGDTYKQKCNQYINSSIM